MKKLSLISIPLLSALSVHAMIPGSPLSNYFNTHKAPLNIVGVSGMMPNNYSVVYTTISIDPAHYTPQQLGPSPLITRAQVGALGPNQTSCAFQAQLEVPTTPLDLVQATHGIPDLAAKIAGAVNPMAGAIGGAVSGLLQIGLQMTSDQINTMLGTQQTTVGVVEILPTKYYRVNRDTNEIELTPAFKQDLATYNALHEQALPAVQQFNTVNKQYQEQRIQYYATYHTYEVVDDNPTSQTDYDALIALYHDELIPALKTAVTYLKQLEQFSMHRISIMAINAKPGDNCINNYHGPYHLYVYMYLGAKAVNTFQIDYCVKSATKLQPVIIKITPDILSTNPLRWQQGGIKIIAVNSNNHPCTTDCVVGFQTQRGDKIVMANESPFCSWWDSMIISGDKTHQGLSDYLLPFDLYQLEQQVNAKNNAQMSSVTEAATKALEVIKNLINKPSSQNALLNPASTNGSPTNQSTDLFSILDLVQSQTIGGNTNFEIPDL